MHSVSEGQQRRQSDFRGVSKLEQERDQQKMMGAGQLSDHRRPCGPF